MKNFRIIKYIAFSSLLSLGLMQINAQEARKLIAGDSLISLENRLISNLTDEVLELGYNHSLTRNEVTGAISSVSGAELEKTNTISPANSLYGLIPGLTVLRNSGSASWREPTMFIRGLNTTGNRSILVLIDGVEADLARLSTLSIESVEVLKDAAALAIYGQRGANGVLMVTTKRGTKQKMEVDIHLETGVHRATELPNLLDAPTYAERVNEALRYDGLAEKYSQGDIDKYRSGEYPSLYPNVNWQEEAYKDWGEQTNLNIAFRGGDDKVTYFTELDYRSENGLYTEDYHTSDYSTQLSYDRINFRTNIDVTMTNTTTFKAWVAGGIDETNQPGANTSSTNTAIINTPANAFPIKNYNDNWGGNAIYPNNPAAMISSSGYYRYQGFDIMVKGAIEQDMSSLLEGLSGDFTVGYNMHSNSSDGQTKTYEYEELKYVEATPTSPADTISTIYGTESDLAVGTGYGKMYRSSTFSGRLKYNKQIGDHSFNSFLLYSQDNYIGKGQYTTYLRQSIAANVHYGYKNKYFGDITVSHSGTSQLPVGNQFNTYPAISGAWVLSEEDFVDNTKAVRYLKLRGSFGYAGNDYITQNSEDTQYTNVGSYRFTESNTTYWAAGEGRLAGTPKTELAMMANIGIDANLFGKLSVNLDAFYNKRSNIMVSSDAGVSDVLGTNAPLEAIGETVNRGIETSLTWQDQIGDFSYSAMGQFSFARNKINEYGEKARAYDYLNRTGNSIGQAFGLETDGFFDDQAEIDNSLPQMFSSLAPGDVKYVDQNNDNVIDELDEVAMQYSTVAPEIYYSLSLNADYKGFGINAMLQGAANYTAYLNTASVYKPLINNTNISEFSDNRWTEATAATATLPRLTTLDNDNNYRGNDIWYVSRNFLKVRNVELYYNFQPKEGNKLKLDNVKFFVRGSNLFSLDSIDEMDPEMIGINYPGTSNYNAGVKLSF